jgi:hypothetical protein
MGETPVTPRSASGTRRQPPGKKTAAKSNIKPRSVDGPPP